MGVAKAEATANEVTANTEVRIALDKHGSAPETPVGRTPI